MYKCSATRPSVSGATTEETIEPQTETLTLTAGSVYNATLGKEIVKSSAKEADTPYATWFDAVYIPA